MLKILRINYRIHIWIKTFKKFKIFKRKTINYYIRYMYNIIIKYKIYIFNNIVKINVMYMREQYYYETNGIIVDR